MDFGDILDDWDKKTAKGGHAAGARASGAEKKTVQADPQSPKAPPSAKAPEGKASPAAPVPASSAPRGKAPTDFGGILDDWDKQTAKSAGKKAVQAERKRLDAQALAEKDGRASTGDVSPKPAASVPAFERSLPRVDPLTAWLRTNAVPNKDAVVPESYRSGIEAGEERRRLRNKAPDASIDLHGLTRDEAVTRLAAFFADAHRNKLEKIRIVHGKGNHSEGEAVLKKAAKEFIERSPYAGECGVCDARFGGSGATWVVLKRR